MDILHHWIDFAGEWILGDKVESDAYIAISLSCMSHHISSWSRLYRNVYLIQHINTHDKRKIMYLHSTKTNMKPRAPQDRDGHIYSGLKVRDSLHISSFMSSSLKDDCSKSNTKGDGQVGSSLISWRLDKNG